MTTPPKEEAAATEVQATPVQARLGALVLKPTAAESSMKQRSRCGKAQSREILPMAAPGGVGGIGPAGAGQAGGSGGQAFGGGLYVDIFSPQTFIIDSTIANNMATGGVGGMGGQVAGAGGGRWRGKRWLGWGGGIAAIYSFSLYNSTIAANQAIGSSAGPGGPGVSGATQGPTGYTGPAFAGGIWTASDPASTGLVSSFSTIIALNTSTPSGLAGSPDDVEATFASATNTLLGFGDGATLTSSGNAGNLIGIDPKLGPLQDNGGPTPTMALLPGSPAIDAGSNPLTLTTDQRGYRAASRRRRR